MLTPYCKSAADRITLVKGAGYHHDFNSLGLESMSIPTVFRALPLEVQGNVTKVQLAREQ